MLAERHDPARHLDQCLALIEAGMPVEAALRDLGAGRSELEPLVVSAQGLRSVLAVPVPAGLALRGDAIAREARRRTWRRGGLLFGAAAGLMLLYGAAQVEPNLMTTLGDLVPWRSPQPTVTAPNTESSAPDAELAGRPAGEADASASEPAHASYPESEPPMSMPGAQPVAAPSELRPSPTLASSAVTQVREPIAVATEHPERPAVVASLTPPPTVTPSATPLPTATSTATVTDAPTATHTATPSPTATATPSVTATPIKTATPAPSATPSSTATDRPSETPTSTATPTEPGATPTRPPRPTMGATDDRATQTPRSGRG